MVGSFFHPSTPTQTQVRPAAQLRLHNQYAPTPLSPFAAHKNSPIVTTKSIPTPGTPKPVKNRRPSLTRTQSSPSTTSAPLFPDEVLPNLYISDLETARAVLSPNYSGPGRPQIKYVLTLLDNAKDQPQVFIPVTTENNGRPDFIRKLIKLSDYNEVNLLEKLPEACAFIRESLAQNDGGVLVHCRKGISRSGSVIVAYLMQEFGLGYDDALQRAKKARNKIWPNRSFGEQLHMWKDMNYSLVDEFGKEKTQYGDWRSKTKFRPEVFEL